MREVICLEAIAEKLVHQTPLSLMFFKRGATHAYYHAFYASIMSINVLHATLVHIYLIIHVSTHALNLYYLRLIKEYAEDVSLPAWHVSNSPPNALLVSVIIYKLTDVSTNALMGYMLIQQTWSARIVQAYAKHALPLLYVYHAIRALIFLILIELIVLVSVIQRTTQIVPLDCVLLVKLPATNVLLEHLAYNVLMEMVYSQLISTCNHVYQSAPAISSLWGLNVNAVK